MRFINIHSHQTGQEAGVLQNILQDFDRLPPSGFYSVGLHPWHLKKETAEKQFNALRQAGKNPNVLAIGECGLDKVCETPFGLQEEYFAKQIQLADEINKPLIIHCVRAYGEALQMLKQSRVPVIFHGFHKNKTVAGDILQNGFYLSFGKHLLQPPVAEVFKAVPLDKVFLETDDADINIETIYKTAASIKETDVQSLTNQITQNARQVFGPAIDTI